MAFSRETILATEAQVLSAPAGKLAVSVPGSPLGIGVMGSTDQDARQRFQEALGHWAILSELPE